MSDLEKIVEKMSIAIKELDALCDRRKVARDEQEILEYKINKAQDVVFDAQKALMLFIRGMG